MSQPKLKIGQLRDVIRFAAYVRHDLTGGTSDEFRRQQVGPRLREEIQKLQALDIPARFASDIERRSDEIRYCEKVIARWDAAQLVEPAPKSTAHKHIWLGGPVCVQCGAPFVATH